MIQYHLLRRKLDRWPNFKCRFPFTVMRKMLLELCNRFKFVTSLSSLTLHTVNLLLWKKILSLTLFKIITVSRTTTLIRVFLMGRSGYPTKGGNWVRVSLQGLHARTFLFCWISPPPKNHVSCPSPDHRSHIGKKGNSYSFYQNFCLWRAFSVTQLWLYFKKLDGNNSLYTKQCPTGLSPRHILQVSPFPKCIRLWCCFVVSILLNLNFYGKPWR